MIKQRIQSWKGIVEMVDRAAHRATERFAKESGWKNKEVQSVLKNISRLTPRNKLLLGGLLVGRAVLGDKEQSPKSRLRPKSANLTQTAHPAEVATN